MKDENLKKLKQTQLEILDYIVEICNKNNLEYFLVGGTLLGAVRHKGYIPWDDDLDIGMPRKDYEKFIELFEETDKFILDRSETNNNYWLPFIKIRNKKTCYLESLQKNYLGELGIWVDIFPLDNGNKEKSLIQNLQFILTKGLRRIISIKVNIIVPPKKIVLDKVLALLPYKFLFKLQKFIMTMNKDNDSKYFVNLGSQYGYKKQTHLREKYYPIRKLSFEGREYNAPDNYDYVLTKIYGKNYMELPPIEKRVTHNPLKIVFEDGEEVVFDEKI